MTVSSTTRKAGPLNGNGVTTAFPFTFKVFAKTDIQVTRTVVATGVQSVLVLDSDYTVTLNADQDGNPGGTITYPASGSPLPVGQKLDVVDVTPMTQDTDISNAGRFLPQVVEDALDRVVIMAQQLYERVTRAITIPVGETASLTLPAAAQRAGKAIVFDGSGNVGVSSDIAAAAAAAQAAAIEAQTFVSPVSVVDYTALRAYAGTATVLRVTGYLVSAAPAGYSGFFTRDDSDTTSTDNGGTIIVASSGKRWKRNYTGALDPKWFGAKGDGVTNDAAIIQSTIDLLDKTVGGSIFLDGKFYCGSTTILIRRAVHLFGPDDGAKTFTPSILPKAELQFDGTANGVWIQRGSESADGGAGDGALLENLGVRALVSTGYSHGVRITATSTCRNVAANGWSGNGFNIVATAPTNNANRWRLDLCRARSNGGHGVYIDGADANAGIAIGVDASSNGGWGIYDSSFLGNTFVGCHTNGNTLGPYTTDNLNAASVFIGCYSESNQGPSVFAQRTSVKGGLHAAGIIGGLRDGDITDSQTNRTEVQYARRTAAGAGYTSAPTVTFDAPTGASTATATATVVGGVITKIAITGSGAGYGSNPTVTITDGTGSGAVAVAQISAPFLGTAGAVRSITVQNGGTGYSATPTVTIDPPTSTTATGTAVLDSAGGVDHILVTNPGSGYTTVPNIVLAGGGGAGAAFTAVLTGNDTFTASLGGDINNGDILKWAADHIQQTATPVTYRLRFINNNSGDMTLDTNNGGTQRWVEFTGPFTSTTFGRANTVPRAVFFSKGVFVGIGRMISVETTIPPTSGQYARGDVIFARDPVAAGSPGVVCTTSGTAGSTAVFKAMANIAA